MSDKRRIEIISAGCTVCQKTVSRVTTLACDSCEVTVLDINDADVAARATALGVASVPAILIDGALASCCDHRGPDDATLLAAGLG